MSSIYDALKRLQDSGQTPGYASPPAPAAPGTRFWLIVLIAVLAGALITLAGYTFFSGAHRHTPPERTAMPPATMHPLPAPAPVPHSLPAPAVIPPQDPAALASQADSLRKAGQLAAAAQLYEKVIALEPARSKDVYISLGTCYFEQHDTDKALKAYREGLKQFPDDAVIQNNLGGVLLAKGQIDRAIAYFQLASSASKDYVEPVYNLACALARKGDRDQAIKALKKAMAMHPDVEVWARQDPDLESIKGAWMVKESKRGNR